MERLEDAQNTSAESICESQLSHAIAQEANVALLEKSLNHESK